MARRYRTLYPQGRSRPKICTYADTCDNCGGAIPAGSEVCYDDVPRPKSIYHVGCPSVQPQSVTAADEPQAEAAPQAPQQGAQDVLDMVENAVQAYMEAHPVAANVPQATPGDERAARIAVEKALDKALTEQRIKALVEAVTPHRIVVEVKTEKGKAVEVEGAHFLLPRCLRLIAQGFDLYLWGPAGSGKTTLAFQIATALKREAEIEILTPDTSRPMLFGFRSPDGKKMETALTRCASKGHVLVMDELDLGTGRVQTTLNAVLAQRRFQAAWGEISCHDEFIFIGTGNTPGAPTQRYPDRQRMSEAFKDRLYFVHVPIDRNIMRRATGRAADWLPPRRIERTCTPQEWGEWAEAVMDWCEVNMPTLPVGPRAAILGVKALAAGETPEEIAHGLVFRGADASIVSKVLNANPLPWSVS